MKRKTLLSTIAALAVAIPTLATAEATQWLETDGGNIRVVMEPFIQGSQTVRGFIDIDLEPGWKTYWRDPGSGGIPPSITFINTNDYAVSNMDYPVPVEIESKYGNYAGYDKPVQIPFTVQSAMQLQTMDVPARVMIGICKDICIPAFANIDIPFTKANGTTQSMIDVQSVFDRRPDTSNNAGVDISIDKADEGSVTFTASGDVDTFQVFATGRQGEQFELPEMVSGADGKKTYEAKALHPLKDKKFELMIAGRTASSTFETTVPVDISESGK